MQLTLVRSSSCASPSGMRQQAEFATQHGDGTTSRVTVDLATAAPTFYGPMGGIHEVLIEPAGPAQARRDKAARLVTGTLAKLVHAEPRAGVDPQDAALSLLEMLNHIAEGAHGPALVDVLRRFYDNVPMTKPASDSEPVEREIKPRRRRR